MAKITNTQKFKIQSMVLEDKSPKQIAKELKLPLNNIIEYVEQTVESIMRVAENQKVAPQADIHQPVPEAKPDFTAPPKHKPKGHYVMTPADSMKSDTTGPNASPRRDRNKEKRLATKTEQHIFRPQG